MTVRKSVAVWEGNLKSGKGNLRFGSGVYEGPYSFASRFEEAPGINPEELIAAAHAGCFTMFLSALLSDKGFPPKKIETVANVTLSVGPEITKLALDTKADVPGINEELFLELAENAKKNCSISKALSAVPMEMMAKLL